MTKHGKNIYEAPITPESNLPNIAMGRTLRLLASRKGRQRLKAISAEASRRIEEHGLVYPASSEEAKRYAKVEAPKDTNSDTQGRRFIESVSRGDGGDSMVEARAVHGRQTQVQREQESHPSRENLIRRRVRRSLGAAATGALLAGVIGGAMAATRGSDGPEYGKGAEAGLAKIVDSELNQASQLVQADLKAHGHQTIPYQVQPGVTLLQNSADKGSFGYAVAFKDLPGTTQPNFNKPVAAILNSDVTDSSTGLFANSNIIVTTPDSAQDLPADATNNNKIDAHGYNVLRVDVSGQNDLVTNDGTENSGDSSQFGVDNIGNTLGPVQTASQINSLYYPKELSTVGAAIGVPGYESPQS